MQEGQEAAGDAIRLWADAVQSITSSIPTPNLPYSDKLPRPEEFVANAYDFAEQLLTSQRKFAENVLEETKPPLSAKEGPGGQEGRHHAITPHARRAGMPGPPRMTNIKARLEGAHAAP